MSEWPDERVEQLKALWKQGLSATQVAKQMGGISRGAVCGKVWRLGLEPRGVGAGATAAVINRKAAGHGRRQPFRTPPPPAPKSKPRKPRRGEHLPPDHIILRADAWAPLAGSTPRALADRPAHGCRWPVELAGETLLCCQPSGEDRYCPSHRWLSAPPERTATQKAADAARRLATQQRMTQRHALSRLSI